MAWVVRISIKYRIWHSVACTLFDRGQATVSVRARAGCMYARAADLHATGCILPSAIYIAAIGLWQQHEDLSRVSAKHKRRCTFEPLQVHIVQ